MNSRRISNNSTLFDVLRRAFGVAALAAALGLPACGGHDEALMKSRINELEDRLKEMERDGGRQRARMEDVNDRINLMTDRVETNRLALERRGVARPLPVVVATPTRTGETGMWSPPPYVPPAQPARSIDRGYKKLQFDENRVRARIPVPGTGAPSVTDYRAEVRAEPSPSVEDTSDYETVVITEEEFAAEFSDDDSGGGGGRSGSIASSKGYGSSAPRSSSGGRAPQATVVHDEKLPVVDTNAAPAKPAPKIDDSATPMETYKSALARYRAGDYGAALTGFKAYLQKGPSEEYLDNAYYWLGECSYGLAQYNQAITYFDRVLKETPNGNKVPDSMLKAALAYHRIGSEKEARSIMLNLVETYPSTNAAKIATKKLNEL